MSELVEQDELGEEMKSVKSLDVEEPKGIEVKGDGDLKPKDVIEEDIQVKDVKGEDLKLSEFYSQDHNSEIPIQPHQPSTQAIAVENSGDDQASRENLDKNPGYNSIETSDENSGVNPAQNPDEEKPDENSVSQIEYDFLIQKLQRFEDFPNKRKGKVVYLHPDGKIEPHPFFKNSPEKEPDPVDEIPKKESKTETEIQRKVFAPPKDFQFQTNEKDEKQIQTDPEGDFELIQISQPYPPSLFAFFTRITEPVCKYLKENENKEINKGHREYQKAIGILDQGQPKRIFKLKSAKVSDGFQVSCLSWSRNGGQIAVGHSFPVHETWCNHSAVVSIWNINLLHRLIPQPKVKISREEELQARLNEKKLKAEKHFAERKLKMNPFADMEFEKAKKVNFQKKGPNSVTETKITSCEFDKSKFENSKYDYWKYEAQYHEEIKQEQLAANFESLKEGNTKIDFLKNENENPKNSNSKNENLEDNSQDLDSGDIFDKPQMEFKFPNCITAMKFHPFNYGTLAVGLRDGTVAILSVEATDDKIESNNETHNGEITDIKWIYSDKIQFPLPSGYSFATSSKDGAICLWGLNAGGNKPILIKRFLIWAEYLPGEIKIGNRYKEGFKELPVVCFSSAKDDPTTMVFATLGGLIFQGSFTSTLEVDISDNVVYYSGQVNMKKFPFFDPIQAVVAKDFGLFSSVDSSPFLRNIFLYVTIDGRIGIQNLLYPMEATKLFFSETPKGCQVEWGTRPHVFGVSSGPTVYIYDLAKNDNEPCMELVEESEVNKFAFNFGDPTVMATGDSNGQVCIWKLPDFIVTPIHNEVHNFLKFISIEPPSLTQRSNQISQDEE